VILQKAKNIVWEGVQSWKKEESSDLQQNEKYPPPTATRLTVGGWHNKEKKDPLGIGRVKGQNLKSRGGGEIQISKLRRLRKNGLRRSWGKTF